jgi:hypothetical protein
VDGHSHHDRQKRDLQVSKKGNLTLARGIEQTKKDARGIDLGCNIVNVLDTGKGVETRLN